jgi:hypothetical protein
MVKKANPKTTQKTRKGEIATGAKNEGDLGRKWGK